MTDTEAQPVDAVAILQGVPRAKLPEWLSKAIDVVAQNAETFPPVKDEDRHFAEHMYPH